MWDPNNKADAVVESIKKSAARTQLVMAHIDKMLTVFAEVCNKSRKPEDSRQYRVIKARYIDTEEKTIDDIAEQECIDRNTVYRDIKAACETLSCLVFGLDGIKS